jgi:hypothetical protein
LSPSFSNREPGYQEREWTGIKEQKGSIIRILIRLPKQSHGLITSNHDEPAAAPRKSRCSTA